MATLDNISNIETDNKPPAPAPNVKKTSVHHFRCEHLHYKRCILVLVSILLITIVVTVPTVLVHKRKTKASTTPSPSTTTTTIITTEGPLYAIITDTTKWKQNGITVFQQFDFDESAGLLNGIEIDDDGTIYMTEASQHRVIEIKVNITSPSIVAGGIEDEDGIHQLWKPSDVIVDKKTSSLFICDGGNMRIVRWPRKNGTNGDIIIPNVFCSGLAMDDKGYLYVSSSDWGTHSVRKWEIGVNNNSTLIAGGNGILDPFAQLKGPTFLFVDKDDTVYVVDESNHRVMKWLKNAKTGIIVAGGNGAGSNLTQLSRPTGVVVDHLGNVYVADKDNDRVMRWNNGAKEGSIIVGGNGPGNETNQLWSPNDLLFDKHGNLYVLDSTNCRIQKFYIESY